MLPELSNRPYPLGAPIPVFTGIGIRGFGLLWILVGAMVGSYGMAAYM